MIPLVEVNMENAGFLKIEKLKKIFVQLWASCLALPIWHFTGFLFFYDVWDPHVTRNLDFSTATEVSVCLKASQLLIPYLD